MSTILEYIEHEGDRRMAVEALKAGSKGLSFDESVFAKVNEKELTELLFEALKDYDSVNESEKNILDCIHDVANEQEVDEGVIAGVLGGLAGLAFGPKVGQALCNVFNIGRGGPLWDLFNSRLVTSAICLKLGLRA